jgi:hypothetical protein
MAAEIFAGTAQLCLTTFNAERSEKLCTSITGELFQLTTWS